MNAGSQRESLLKLKELLDPLVKAYELDDPDRGLLGVIPVVGGVFVHPLTRESISEIKVYGAGRELVKLAEPRFLRSLPRIPVRGVTHASQFCAYVAKTLSEYLGELGRIRDRIAAMGISLDLERDVLNLRGKVELQDGRVHVSTRKRHQLAVTAIGSRDVTGIVSREERTLRITDEPTVDLDELAKLVRHLDETTRREELETLEASLDLSPGERSAVPSPADPIPTAPPVGPEVDGQLPPPPVEESAARPEHRAEAGERHPEPAHPRFAEGTSDVLELTETVDEEDGAPPVEPGGQPMPPDFAGAPPVEPGGQPMPTDFAGAPPDEPGGQPMPPDFAGAPPDEPPSVFGREPAPAAPEPLPAASGAGQESLGSLRIRELFDKMGSEAEIASHGGRIRLVVPMKVIQGLYTFYLEQSGATTFVGVLQTPSGVRHQVSFDLRSILDIKDVFDGVMGG